MMLSYDCCWLHAEHVTSSPALIEYTCNTIQVNTHLYTCRSVQCLRKILCRKMDRTSDVFMGGLGYVRPPFFAWTQKNWTKWPILNQQLKNLRRGTAPWQDPSPVGARDTPFHIPPSTAPLVPRTSCLRHYTQAGDAWLPISILYTGLRPTWNRGRVISRQNQLIEPQSSQKKN